MRGLLALLLFLLLPATALPAHVDSFTIALLGDTQTYTTCTENLNQI